LVAFMFGGYVSGRLSRRSGAIHGLLAGVFGAVLAAIAGVAIIGTGTDNGLARVANHINVAASWHEWRYFGFIGIAVAAAAMVLGGLIGGVKGEQWHGKLLARAIDPAYGPEAADRAEARKRVTEAEVARLAAADHVGRLTAAAKTSRPAAAVPEPTAPAPAVPAAAVNPVGPSGRVSTGRWFTNDRQTAETSPRSASAADVRPVDDPSPVGGRTTSDPAMADDSVATDGEPRRTRHLLGRR
jgi:hypothetical protein